MEVAILGSAAHLLASGRALDIAASRRQGLQNRVEALDGGVRAANHHAVAARDAPHAAARPHVHVVDALGLEPMGATHIVLEHGIATIDDDVVGPHQSGQRADRVLSDLPTRQHHPCRARRFEFAHSVLE
jgi:hypothetical protein